jgi:hypothetical protein
MKKIMKLLKLTLTLCFFLGFNLLSMAQSGPPPPPPGGGHGQTTNQLPEGGTAPVGGGMALLLGLGAAWGAGKMAIARRR